MTRKVGFKHSEETKKKMRKPHPSIRGENNPAKRSEVRRKISEHLRRHPTKCMGMRGKHHTNKTKEKLRLVNQGKTLSAEHKRKISKSLSGEKSPNFGKHFSLKTRQKMSEAQKGEKSACWRGGSSFEPYPSAFNRELKNIIRERDNYACQLCGTKTDFRKLSVHHINYNKKDCRHENLITLCHRCNTKVNKNRINWERYFSESSEFKPEREEASTQHFEVEQVSPMKQEAFLLVGR